MKADHYIKYNDTIWFYNRPHWEGRSKRLDAIRSYQYHQPPSHCHREKAWCLYVTCKYEILPLTSLSIDIFIINKQKYFLSHTISKNHMKHSKSVQHFKPFYKLDVLCSVKVIGMLPYNTENDRGKKICITDWTLRNYGDTMGT